MDAGIFLLLGIPLLLLGLVVPTAAVLLIPAGLFCIGLGALSWWAFEGPLRKRRAEAARLNTVAAEREARAKAIRAQAERALVELRRDDHSRLAAQALELEQQAALDRSWADAKARAGRPPTPL